MSFCCCSHCSHEQGDNGAGVDLVIGCELFEELIHDLEVLVFEVAVGPLVNEIV